MADLVSNWLQNQQNPVFLVKWPHENFITAFVLNQKIQTDFRFSWVQFDGQTTHYGINQSKTFALDLPQKIVMTHLDGPADSAHQKEAHMQLVQKALNTIKTGAVEKVVLARQASYSIKKFDAASTYFRLANKYPHAAVYWFFHPSNPHWMGATPELLLESHGTTFQTVSLAGTRPSHTKGNWGNKEVREQQVVTDFIQESLIQLGATNLEVSPPTTAQSGPVEHLKSFLKWQMPGIEKPVEKILAALHPTPAVCGLPRDVAKSFIHQNENFDRQAYAGYFGFGDSAGTRGKYFVNLRCLQWTGPQLHLYAGGGINSGSDPAAEWVETENKLQTLLAVL